MNVLPLLVRMVQHVPTVLLHILAYACLVILEPIVLSTLMSVGIRHVVMEPHVWMAFPPTHVTVHQVILEQTVQWI